MIRRRNFFLCIGALGGCGFPADTRERRSPSEAFIAASQPDAVVSGEGFAFGPEDESGTSLGLRVHSMLLRKRDKLRYEVALRNRGPSAVHRSLYSNLSGPWGRTQLVCYSHGAFAILGQAVDLDDAHDPVSMPIGVDMEVEAGETRARPGTPLVVDAEGEVELYLLFGGRPFFKFEQVSGVVRIEVTA